MYKYTIVKLSLPLVLILSSASLRAEEILSPSVARISQIMISGKVSLEKIKELLGPNGLFERALQEASSLKEAQILEASLKEIFMVSHKLNYDTSLKVSRLYTDAMIMLEEHKAEKRNAYIERLKKYSGSNELNLNKLTEKFCTQLEARNWLMGHSDMQILFDLVKAYGLLADKSELSPENSATLKLFGELVVFSSFNSDLFRGYNYLDLKQPGFSNLRAAIKRTRPPTRAIKR